MAPAKAVAWPREIYNDDEVQSLDGQGRFIICRVCAESYAAQGGKTPKAVAMNACFRTRAWETHKRRTRAHRKPRSNDSFNDTSNNNAASRLLGGGFISTALPQRVAAESNQMGGYIAQYKPLAVMDNLAFNRSYGRRSSLPELKPRSFVNLLSLAEPSDLAIQNVHHETDSPSSRGITTVARPPHSHSCVPEMANHWKNFATRALPLSQLLNPVDRCGEATPGQSRELAVQHVAGSEQGANKRQRMAVDAIPTQTPSLSARDDLYWKTLREVFACGLTGLDQNDLRRPQHHTEDHAPMDY